MSEMDAVSRRRAGGMHTHAPRVPAVLVVLLLACLTPLAGCAARQQPAGAPTSWPQDEAEIRAAARASTEAWNRGDLQGHLAIYVDTVTFMTADGPRPGVDAIHDAFARTYFSDGAPNQQLRFEQLAVRPLGRDAALQTGRFVLSGGGAPDQTGWFTLVWIRTPAGWRAVHDHSS
jgi:uncharacterized protein (TIGR02246 family)